VGDLAKALCGLSKNHEAVIYIRYDMIAEFNVYCVIAHIIIIGLEIIIGDLKKFLCQNLAFMNLALNYAGLPLN